MKLFKIRSSCIGKIMGRIGLTDKQKEKITLYRDRASGKGRALTAIQSKELADLEHKNANPKLPETCISYLKQWYSEQRYGDNRELNTKYTNKGNECEYEAIGLVEEMEGESFIVKNEVNYENDFMTGTPDVITSIIYDTKCAWDSGSFLASITGTLNPDYEWQMRGYMCLLEIDIAKVCYCLVDTPEDVNFGQAVSYGHIPKNEKYYAFFVERVKAIELEIRDRVELCRKWLDGYDCLVEEKLKMGKK